MQYILCPSGTGEPAREVSPLRDRRTFETDNEYLQYLAQRRKQQETLRDRQRDRRKRSRPKREREQLREQAEWQPCMGALRRDMCAPPLSARGPGVCVCPGWACLNE